MSAENPAVGDVWTFRQDPPAPAVIVSELAGANGFQLMSRTGRIISVTRPSLRHMWDYTGISHQGPCSIGGCLLPAGVLVRESWFCGSHAPRNQTVGLPGDSGPLPNQPVNGALSHCPICNTTREPHGAMSVVEELTIHRCSCRARWVALLAQGIPEDGVNLGEDIQAAYGLLEDELCSPIRAYVGATALAAFTRTFREIPKAHPIFAGIPLIRCDTYGNDTVLLVGSPVSTQDDEVAFEKLLGTYWQHKEWSDVICRVYGAEETSREDREVHLVDWLVVSKAVVMKENQLLRDYTPKEAPTRTVLPGGTFHLAFPPEHVGSVPLSNTNAPWLLDNTEVADASDKLPVIGETWWNLTTGKPAQVFGMGRTQSGHTYTRAVLEGGIARRILTEDFVRYYTFSPIEELEVVVGQEYLRDDNTVWTLQAVALPILNLESPAGVVEPVRLVDFKFRYQKYVRRSAFDRLLNSEDLV